MLSRFLALSMAVSVFTALPINKTYAMETQNTLAVIENNSETHIITVDGKPRVVKDGLRIIVVAGKLIRWPAEMPDPTPDQIKALKQEKGKFGLAIKAIKKGYSKLPAPVKKYIKKYLGLNVILGTLDHWTGAIEDGIYWGCKQVGMPDWMAWTVAKALTMIALQVVAMFHFSPRFKQVVMLIVTFIWLGFAMHDLYYQRWIIGIIKLVISVLGIIIYTDIENFKQQSFQKSSQKNSSCFFMPKIKDGRR